MSISLEAAVLYDTSPVDDPTEHNEPAPRDANDATLVLRARRGDYDAFEELVRRYRNDVVALAHHFVGNREDAWDLSQEVFIKIFRSLKRFRGEASFKTWLLRITANQCKDHFKKRRLKTTAFENSAVAQNRATGQRDPREALEAAELGDSIRAGLDTLNEKHRTVLVLREFEGLSYDEMAAVIGCSLGTVMSRLHHARKKLQQTLTRMGVVEDV